MYLLHLRRRSGHLGGGTRLGEIIELLLDIGKRELILSWEKDQKLILQYYRSPYNHIYTTRKASPAVPATLLAILWAIFFGECVYTNFNIY